MVADRLLLCTPNGPFSFFDLKDNERMARLFTGKPESEPLRSIVLGTLAMFLQFFGYLALGIWMRPVYADGENRRGKQRTERLVFLPGVRSGKEMILITSRNGFTSDEHSAFSYIKVISDLKAKGIL